MLNVVNDLVTPRKFDANNFDIERPNYLAGLLIATIRRSYTCVLVFGGHEFAGQRFFTYDIIVCHGPL